MKLLFQVAVQYCDLKLLYAFISALKFRWRLSCVNGLSGLFGADRGVVMDDMEQIIIAPLIVEGLVFIRQPFVIIVLAGRVFHR